MKAVTGTFNDTFYGAAEDQLDALRQAADACSPRYVAQAAVYARQRGGMKDMPAALCVILSKADMALLDKVDAPVVVEPAAVALSELLRNSASGGVEVRARESLGA